MSPPFPSFLSYLYSQHLPWSVFRSFPHKPVLLFFSKKNTLPTFLPAPITPIHMPLIIFPPFKISNSANFPLPNITSPHHDFFPPNFTLPTLFTNPPLENSTSNIITTHPPLLNDTTIPLHPHPFNDITAPPPPLTTLPVNIHHIITCSTILSSL